MQLDQRSVTPFTANKSRNDVVHRTKNDHGEKRIKAEMRIGDAGFGEMDVAGNGAQRNQQANHTKDRIRHRAEHGEPQRWTVTHKREIALHGHVMIEPDSSHGNHRQNGRSDAGRDHPRRKRAVHESCHSHPA